MELFSKVQPYAPVLALDHWGVGGMTEKVPLNDAQQVHRIYFGP
jgi:hypothetical protein